MIHFDISKLQSELNDLESLTNKPEFWNSPEKTTPILSKIKIIQNKINKYNSLQQECLNLQGMNELLFTEYEKDLVDELIKDTKYLEENINKLEIQTLLCEKYDKNNAILTLHPGARRYRISRLGRNVI